MEQDGFWRRAARVRVGRRRLLAGAGTGAVGLAALACSSRGGSRPAGSTTGAQPTAPSAAAPQPGGTYTSYIQYNAILDPHKAQAGAQTVIGGVYSRVFRFTTGTDPKVCTDHNIEPDLGVSAESPDATTWTVKLRPDLKFHNIAPVNGH